MRCSIAVISARHEDSGHKVYHVRPADTLDEAFRLLEQEDCLYNFARIEIRHDEFVYIINKKNRIYSARNNINTVSDRRQAGCRRSGVERRQVARDTGDTNDRRRAII